jgi:maltose-binding protein MalE
VQVTDTLMKQAVDAFSLGTAFPVIPEMGAYWDAMDTALKSVLNENADITAALKKADESIKAKVAEIRKG